MKYWFIAIFVLLLAGCSQQEEDTISTGEKFTMNLTESTFEETIREAKGVAVVDFWAPWCGPCNMMEPVIQEVAKEYEGRAVVGKINIDEEKPLSATFGVTAIPAILFFKDGELQPEMTLEGIQTKDSLKEKIDLLLSLEDGE